MKLTFFTLFVLCLSVFLINSQSQTINSEVQQLFINEKAAIDNGNQQLSTNEKAAFDNGNQQLSTNEKAAFDQNFFVFTQADTNLKTSSQPLPTISFVNTEGLNQNTLQNNQIQKLLTFDQSQKNCIPPRIWLNNKCVCPNNWFFISGQCLSKIPTNIPNDVLTLRFINRNHDGTQNNVRNPFWGAKATPFKRLCEANNYEDDLSIMWRNRPNPRNVSNSVGAISSTIPANRIGMNMLWTIWGQFLDHDITLTIGGGIENANIPIPRCDRFFDRNCTGTKQFRFSRSIFDQNKPKRTNINTVTSWIDASQIYGSDKQTADRLRSFSQGKLLTSAGNLLPKNNNGQFLAGDLRVNQNPALSAFHTVFLRQHNRLCNIITARDPRLTDQQIYQIARNYVIGLVQKITFEQFLPILLGRNNYVNLVGPYRSYNQLIQPTLFTEFSTAAFRLGHPFVNSPMKLIDNNGKLIRNLALGEMFFNPNVITNTSLDQILIGLAKVPAKQRSLELVDDLRNFLFFPPNAQIRLDLFALNVQRGRDHGICTLNDAREKVGLSRKLNFADIFSNSTKAANLQNLYQNNVNLLDMWLGIIGQPSLPGSALGQLGIRVNAMQFKNLRDSDRFWYQNVYPSNVIRAINSTTFGDVIRRNTGVRNINFDTFRV